VKSKFKKVLKTKLVKRAGREFHIERSSECKFNLRGDCRHYNF